MGTSQSLPDVKSQSGGLMNSQGTVDGGEPTPESTKIRVYPTGGPVQFGTRKLEAEIRNEAGKVLYSTKPAKGLKNGFDLVDKEGKVLVRVGSLIGHHWCIYWVEKPSYKGQKKDDLATEKSGEECFKRADVKYDEFRFQAKVFLHGTGGSKDLNVPALEITKHENIPVHYTTFAPFKGEPKPVGYWTWKKEPPVVGQDFAEIEVAKHSDLVLHALLAVITHIVAIQRRQGNVPD